MIDRIELENFQSHKKSVLELDPGINAIIGPSNNGKTSIIRALKLSRYNQPSGTAYISKWAKDKKGNQTKQMSVTVTKGKHTLTRGKGSKLNGYQINDNDPLEALRKGGLPDQVVNFYNTNDVNLQEQMDKPFLIGSTPPEVAKFLNTIVDMTEIDVYLSAVESKKRSTNKDIKRVKGEVKDLEVKITRFDKLGDVEFLLERLYKVSTLKTQKINDREILKGLVGEYTTLQGKSTLWGSIDSLEKLIISVQEVKSRHNTVIDRHSYLLDTIILYKISKQTLTTFKNVNKVEKLLTNLTSTKKEIAKINNKWNKLHSSELLYTENIDILKKSIDTDKIEILLKDLEKVQKSKKELNSNRDTLRTLFKSHKENTRIMVHYNVLIKDHEKQLPDICPTCGAPLKGKKI